MHIPDIKEIAVAWARAANPTPEQQEIATERINTCDTCEHKDFKKLVRMYTCGLCGCPLNKKVYSPKGSEGCPAGKWVR